MRRVPCKEDYMMCSWDRPSKDSMNGTPDCPPRCLMDRSCTRADRISDKIDLHKLVIGTLHLRYVKSFLIETTGKVELKMTAPVVSGSLFSGTLGSVVCDS
uniref:Uncharacterized protein n=1 Tax=Timema cristinae TaxID=61476 RepID=A0A7R9CYF5_TIMCR|nr:unnamed protein product [Timema cristinae]